jgi:hypothetical protein
VRQPSEGRRDRGSHASRFAGRDRGSHASRFAGRDRPELAHFSYLIWDGRAAGNPGWCRSRRAGAAAASGRGMCRCAGGGRWGGLPVTSAHFGMRTRNLAWRWGLDLRVAQCCLEHAGQYSGPGARRPGPAGSSPYPLGQAQEVAAVSRPQVIDDQEHERVHDRVAATAWPRTPEWCAPAPRTPGPRHSGGA